MTRKRRICGRGIGIRISIFMMFVLSGFACLSQIKNWPSEKELIERRAETERFMRHMERDPEAARNSMKKARAIRNLAKAKERVEWYESNVRLDGFATKKWTYS